MRCCFGLTLLRACRQQDKAEQRSNAIFLQEVEISRNKQFTAFRRELRIERIATDRNKAKVRRRGRKPDENAKKQGLFCVLCGHKPGYITQGTFQRRLNHVRPHTSRLAVRGGEPLTMQRSERWAVFQVRGHNGQHGDIASPLGSIRDHGLAVDASATLPGRSLVHLTFLVSVAYVLLERTRAESFTSGRRGHTDKRGAKRYSQS